MVKIVWDPGPRVHSQFFVTRPVALGCRVVLAVLVGEWVRCPGAELVVGHYLQGDAKERQQHTGGAGYRRC